MSNRRVLRLLFLLLFLTWHLPLTCHSLSVAQAERAFPRLVSDERDSELRGYAPKVEDRSIQSALDDPATIFYTDEEMPPCYQERDGGLRGAHSIHYNISADPGEPFGNGNLEFPWKDTAGLSEAQNASAVRFLSLPVDEESGERLPIVWYRKTFRGDAEPGYGWQFPAGTVVGEVLLLYHSDKVWRPFEMRVRVREIDDWAVDVFRPFRSPGELAEAVRERRPNWSENPELVALIEHLEGKPELPLTTLSNDHPVSVFREQALVDSLPPLGDLELSASLLENTVFKSSLGKTWRESDESQVYAPTAASRDHIVPSGYRGGFIEVERSSCMRLPCDRKSARPGIPIL